MTVINIFSFAVNTSHYFTNKSLSYRIRDDAI